MLVSVSDMNGSSLSRKGGGLKGLVLQHRVALVHLPLS